MSTRWNRSIQQLAVGSLLAAAIVQPLHALAEKAPVEQTSVQSADAPKEADAGSSNAFARMVPLRAAANVPKNFALGDPVWWFDFRNYRGGEIAKRQSTPLLVLQGDNDFQVTASNLDGWKSALSTRQDVVYKLYPKLNHGFVEFDQPSTGKEYALPGNVPSYVIDDIAGWLTGKN
ncbi:dienelactone hydrolase family protein [Paenibacillus tyrfis]|uniref:dienelactone hydrolase family protein n=1 Tax=Paenibacillus tyrfis TaxID=1501230 RepID=UPI00209E7BE6|nr:dienelactone hydrolase family protein [Paenibacillus tyrfis]MCP1307373.1 S9 family peptidase [Paenibacillus tyrfis]